MWNDHRPLAALWLLSFCLPGSGLAAETLENSDASCALTTHADWGRLRKDCSTIDLNGKTIEGTLYLDEGTFRGVPTDAWVTLKNGTVNGGGQTCLNLNRTNVRLEGLELVDCRDGVRIEASENRGDAQGAFVFANLTIRQTSRHGITLGHINGGTVHENVRILDAQFSDHGGDSIAGELAPEASLRIEADFKGRIGLAHTVAATGGPASSPVVEVPLTEEGTPPAESVYRLFAAGGHRSLDAAQFKRLITGRMRSLDGQSVIVVLPTGDPEAMAWITQATGVKEAVMLQTLREQAFRGAIGGLYEVGNVQRATEVIARTPGAIGVSKAL